MNDSDASAAPRGVLIVGGGLVGASLAIALDEAGVACSLVDAAAPRAPAAADPEERNLALARATVNGLRAIGVWPRVADRATPITHIHVSRAGDFGSARIEASRHGVEALGWTLPARELGQALSARLQECRQLTRLAPASLRELRPLAGGWRATVESGQGTQRLEAALLVGADGTESFVRQQLGIQAQRHDYRQTLFVSTVQTQRDPAGRAFERFTDAGPVALLPLAQRRAGLVLTVATDEAQAIAAMEGPGYAALAQQRFGWRLGRLTQPGRRQHYSIQRVVAERLIAPRAVLVGNAAQTVHPIGAQGFNLGLRDALTLAELVAEAADPGAPALLETYAARRAGDREATLTMSHALVRLACLPQPFLGPLRTLGLLAYDRIGPLQSLLARRGMGFVGVPPRAVREGVA